MNANALEIEFPGMKQLSDEERRGVLFIRSKSEVSKKEFAEAMGLEDKTAQRRLKVLMDKGFIIGNGKDKRSKAYAYQIAPQFK